MIKNILFSLMLFLFSICFFFLIKNEVKTIEIKSIATGYSALDIDKSVTRQLEKELLQIEEIKQVKSESHNGKSVIFLDLIYDSKFNNAVKKIKQKVKISKNNIPKDVEIFVDEDYLDIYDNFIGVTLNDENYELLSDGVQAIKNEFLRLNDTAKSKILGEQEEAIYLYFEPNRLSNLKITPDFLLSQVDFSNPLKGGSFIQTALNSFYIFPKDKINSIQDVKNILINLNGAVISLKEIFDIQKTVISPIDHQILINGKNGLVVAIKKKKGVKRLIWNYKISGQVFNLNKKYKDIQIINLKNNVPYEVYFELKNGVSFNQTLKQVVFFENFLKENNLAKDSICFVGSYLPRYSSFYRPFVGDTNMAVCLLDIHRNRISKIRDYLSNNFSLNKFYIRKNSKFYSDNFLKIRIFADDIETLFFDFEKISNKLSDVCKDCLIQHDWGNSVFEFRVSVNKNSAKRAGFSEKEIFDFLNTYYSGKILTKYYRGENIVYIILKGFDINVENQDLFKNLSFYSTKLNSNIPLNQIAEIKPEFSYSKILRYNGQYSMLLTIKTSELFKRFFIINALKKIPDIKYKID